MLLAQFMCRAYLSALEAKPAQPVRVKNSLPVSRTRSVMLGFGGTLCMAWYTTDRTANCRLRYQKIRLSEVRSPMAQT